MLLGLVLIVMLPPLLPHVDQMMKASLSVESYCHSQPRCYLGPSLGEELHLLGRVFRMYDNDKKGRLHLSKVIEEF